MISHEELEAQRGTKGDGRAKTTVPDTRAQDIRIVALQAAVAGSGAGMNADTVLMRAAAFEKYIVDGLDKKEQPGRSWAMAGEPGSR